MWLADFTPICPHNDAEDVIVELLIVTIMTITTVPTKAGGLVEVNALEEIEAYERRKGTSAAH